MGLRLYLEWYPGEYDAHISAIQTRLFNTCELARETYYHPAMNCSFSIKRLAPAVLGVGYADLAIQDGMAAVRTWRQLVQSGPDASPPNSMHGELLAYCRRDTELMSGILDEFMRLVEA